MIGQKLGPYDVLAKLPALVLELIEGETLGDRIARGLKVSEAIAIAQQICPPTFASAVRRGPTTIG